MGFSGWLLTYTNSGTYTQILNNAAGCDSIVTLTLNVLQATAFTLTDTACTTYSLNGQTYTASGTYSQVLTNAAGCDSVLTLQLTLRASTLQLYPSACDSFALNGITYTTSGHYVQHLTNSLGCDSTISIQLAVHSPSSSALQVTSCQSYTLNNQTYLSSGAYLQHLTNAAGCDSIVNLFLTIHPNSSHFIIATACDSFSLHGSTYYGSGVFTQILANANGCDSILDIYLDIDSLDLGIQQSGNNLSAQQAGGSYQWLHCDGIPTPIQGATGQSILTPANGYYAVVVTHQGCQDTSDCVLVTSVAADAGADIRSSSLYPNPNEGQFWVDLRSVSGTCEMRLLHRTDHNPQTVVDIAH